MSVFINFNILRTMLKLAVVGSGVVGSATGKGFRDKGFDVTFVDVDKKTIDQLKKDGFNAIHADEVDSSTADVFFISVPTPTVDGHIQLDYMISAAINLGQRVLKDSVNRHTIIVRSTVPPGTTDKLIRPLLEKESGKKAGVDFGLGMNPEYLREETAVEDFANPWLIAVGSYDDQTAATVNEIYAPFNVPVHRLTLSEAEAQKYVHNLFNAAKISFFNEMRMISKEANIDAEKIFPLVAKSCEGCWSATYGTKNMGPFSGACLPKDTSAFLAWAKDNHTTPMTLLSAVIDVNEQLKSQLSAEERSEIAKSEAKSQQTI